MFDPTKFSHRLALFVSVAITALLAALIPIAASRAAPLAQPTVTTVELTATDDVGATQRGQPDVPHPSVYLVLSKDGQGNYDNNFVQFDLSGLPANATVTAAALHLNIGAFGGPPLDVQLGRVTSAWDEATVTWNNQPSFTQGGPIATISATGDVSWTVTALVQAWQDGTAPNNGFGLRGLNSNGAFVAADSKEVSADPTGAGLPPLAPKLVITYSTPPDVENAHPDLGDAPDSTNHHGVNNTAYGIGGVLGQFPTVWNVPAGQPAGPRHANQTGEGFLGQFISRESEADQGPDQDGPNNILRNAAGVIGDVADRDRGDDGWRNRNIKFFSCQRQTLTVRVSKAPAATLKKMYLNVWFDGNRDGDWADVIGCQPPDGGPAQAGYEWIVQDYVVDMTAIPAGGFLDFNINTERVLNTTEGLPHWMRFTLSEDRAVQPGGGALPDGRGPHPTSAQGSYQFGETEDIFQKAVPAGENGVLELQKRVIADSQPTEWIDYVTYEILLRNNGGSQPVQANIRDLLPYPLIVYPTIDSSGIHYVTVESPTGGATPLQAQLEVLPPQGSTPPQQVVKWLGSLAPNATVKLTFQVRVLALCEPNQQTMTFVNQAQARPQGGAVITADASFTAKCIDYNTNRLSVEAQPAPDLIDQADLRNVPVQYTITNSHAISVNLGFFQLPNSSVNASTADATAARFLGRVTLAPQQAQTVDLTLRMESEFSDELALPPDYTPNARIAFCILPGDANQCPDAQKYPQLNGELPLLPIKVRPNDLGDAPDSTNHAGVAMAAYPAVQANFPTVFDPALGLPQGPRHSYPRPFHLGQRVSREAEADLGPDQDPLNNIVPAANDPDNDRFDDGTNLALWNLNNCQTTNLPVQVAIGPAAVNYFQQLGTPGYINIWIDSNRDGDWADATQCNGQPAVEHIVIDFPVNVVGLGAGLHLINTPTGLVPWSITDKPAWVRITLSDRPSNKTLTAGALNYGDGRGYALPFRTGETEDYYYRPLTGGGNGPDVAVQLSAKVSRDASAQPGLAAAALEQLGNFEIQLFKIDYENIGAAAAQNALFEFQIPAQLRNSELVLVKGTEVTRESISFNFDKLSFTLPHIEQGVRGSVVLGWYGCITCTVTAANANVDYTGSVNATVNGDIDTSNNQSSTTLRGLLSSPIIGAFMDYTDDACMDRVLYGPVVTNRSTIQLRGKAAPNQIIAILIGLLRVATVTSDANGDFVYTANPSGGLLGIHAVYANQVNAAGALIQSPRDIASGQATGLLLKVDPSLPFDPMSTCFVDSKGRAYALPTLGYSFGATQTGTWLRAGETYKVSVNAKSGDLNQYFKVTFEDVLISSLKDDDGDGTYQGLATIPNSVQAASTAATAKLGLLVGNGATENSYSTDLTMGEDGVISDRATNQPLQDATVSALIAQNAEDGATFFTTWAASQAGQPNPQVTGADGKYSYSATTGAYRLDVVRTGYQPYRTATIDASTDSITPNIALSPVINDAPTQTIFITESGFEPALVTVKPGSVIEFVNIGLNEHATQASGWDSGRLTTAGSYKVRFNNAGTYHYADSVESLNQGTIVIDASTPAAVQKVFLPLVNR